MLNFGKSRSGRRGLIGTKWFDPYMGEPRQMKPTYERSEREEAEWAKIRSMKPTKKKAVPQTTVVIDSADYFGEYDFDLTFAYQPYGGRVVHDDQVSKRRWKKLNKRHDGDVPTWMMRKTDIKKVDRYTTKEPLGDLFPESNPDGEEKIARKKLRQVRTHSTRYYEMRKRNAQSWKSVGNRRIGKWTPDNELTPNSGKFVPIGGTRFKARKSWATKKPKIHVPWTIGEETCATFLVWQREDEEWEREYAEVVAREIERDNDAEMLALHNEACDEAEWIAFEELEHRYRKGKWCIENDSGELDPDMMDWDDDSEGEDEETWARHQAA